MQKIQVLDSNVVLFFNAFIEKLHRAGVDQTEYLKYCLALLCRAKGSCDVPIDLEAELGRYNIGVQSDILSLQQICGSKLNNILPVAAEYIIDKGYSWLINETKQPRELTELILSLIKEKGCTTIYNPFAGLASYGLGDFIDKYYGQEIDSRIYNLARMRLQLNDIDNSSYSLSDSIKEWNDHGAECIVSTPPFGMRVDSSSLPLSAHYSSMSVTIEEILLEQFISSPARYGVFVVSRSICVRNKGLIFSLRKSICEKNYLEMAINLPSGIFSKTGVSTSILFLNKDRKKGDSTLIVDAEKMFILQDRRELILNVGDILNAVHTANSETSFLVNHSDLFKNECSFDAMRYKPQRLTAGEGQVIYELHDLLEPDKGKLIDCDGQLLSNVVNMSDYVDNIVRLRTVQNQFLCDKPVSEFDGPRLAINARGHIYVHNQNSRFYVKRGQGQNVFKVNEALVDMEYLAYKLLESDFIEKTFADPSFPRLLLSAFYSYKIVIDSEKKKQQQIVANLKRNFLAHERQRLGIREAGGDLTHMLRLPKETIGNKIDFLLSSDNLSSEERGWVKSISDNFNYMLRLITTVGADFLSVNPTIREIPFAQFLQEYIVSLGNLQVSNCFAIVEDISLDSNVKVPADEDLLRVVLDSAVYNAYKHGFLQRYTDTNRVKIGCRGVEYEGEPFICMTVANNGSRMDSGFSVEDFATLGKKAGTAANTGKGGYHIYAIAKKHNGFINISSSKEWPFILDVLLPASNLSLNSSLEDYGSKCI